MKKSAKKKYVHIGLIRRLFAVFYDIFLLTAILFIVSGIATALNNGTAIDPDNAIYPLFVLIIFVLSYLYFTWFWIHGGQSLGMKTWQIQLQSFDGSAIGWKTVTVRFIMAIFSWAALGMGFLWGLFDRNNRCWHDLGSKTVLIDLRAKK